MEKLPGYFGRNSKNAELAASININFAKADAQISRPRVSDVPTEDINLEL